MHLIYRMMRYLRPYRRQAIGSYTALILAILLQLAVPLLVRQIINTAIGAGDRRFLVLAAVGIVVVTLAQSTFMYTRSYWLQYLAERVAFDCRNEMYTHLERLSFSFYDTAQTGQLLSRATEDVNNIRRFFMFGLRMAAQSFLLLVGVTIVMLRLNWQLALLSLSTVPFLLWVTLWFSVSIRPLFLRAQTQFGVAMNALQENLAGVRVVRAFAREEFEVTKFERETTALYDRQMDAARRWTFVFPLMSFITGLGTAIIIAYGGSAVIRQDLQVGTLLAFYLYLNMLAEPVRNVGWIVNNVARAQASAERVFEVLDKKPQIVSPADAYHPETVVGHVMLDNVQFAYSEESRDVLRGVSIDAPPGSVTALLGATGSGKSSIIQLLPRFYDVTAGAIRVDGVDARDWDLEILRKNVGLVLQETFLFSVSIRENIAYGNGAATDAHVIAAAQAAQAHEFIVTLPSGYDTLLGERGVNLSGGQKQRLAIARALLLNPRILILDDATSSVDMETEFAIQRALHTLMEGRTTFIIAQRLSSVRNADQICVLSEGQIVERGTHVDLLARGGLYTELYDLQMRDEDVVAEGLRPAVPVEADGD
ncbi:MAG: ABC transporter ATP-binding protein/permease [Chloroflexota bacterium]|nr:ABC transporter ATP-binding protein/permease [Chloroflexota bacterium]